MYWGVAKQFGGQELWRELLQVRVQSSSRSSRQQQQSAETTALAVSVVVANQHACM
jgi:hypothetical protein